MFARGRRFITPVGSPHKFYFQFNYLYSEMIETLDVNVSYPLLEELGGWPVLGSNPGGNWIQADFNLTTLMVKLKKYNNGPFIGMYVSSDVKNSEQYIIYVSILCSGIINFKVQLYSGTFLLNLLCKKHIFLFS